MDVVAGILAEAIDGVGIVGLVRRAGFEIGGVLHPIGPTWHGVRPHGNAATNPINGERNDDLRGRNPGRQEPCEKKERDDADVAGGSVHGRSMPAN